MKFAVATFLLLSVLFVIQTDSFSVNPVENLQKELQRIKRDWSWEDIKSKASEIGGKIVDGAKDIGGKIANTTKDVYENRGEYYEKTKTSIVNAGHSVANFTKDTYENRGQIYEDTKSTLVNAGQSVANFTKDTYGKITD